MTGLRRYGILAMLLPGSAALAQSAPRGGAYYGHMWGDGYGMGHSFFGAGVMVLFWIVLVGLAVLAARWLIERQGGGSQGKASGTALDILKERLARGEIEPEEFAARRKALED